MPPARRPPRPPPPRPRPAPPPPPRPRAAPLPQPRPQPAPQAPRPRAAPAPRTAPQHPQAPARAPSARAPAPRPRAAPAPRPRAARTTHQGRPAPRSGHAGKQLGKTVRTRAPAPRRPTAHVASDSPQQVMYDTAVSERVTDRVLRALFLIGTAENDWNTETCNASDHCGVFQLSRTLQAEHNYRDIAYWTNRAINNGFYSYGGLARIDLEHPSWSIGEMVQACQGAGPTFAAAAAYYNSRLAESDGILARYRKAGATLPVRLPPATPSYFNPLAHARVTPERIDQGVDYAGTGYLVAIADGIVTESIANGSEWEGEGYLEYRITQPGELEGAYIYYAEGITPVVRKGEQVRGGARVADLRDYMPHGIELGFAAGYGQESYYRYHDGKYHEGDVTRPGLAFSNLVHRLGGPAGRQEGPVVGKFPEYMQSGEPAPNVNTDSVQPPQAGGGAVPTINGQYTWPSEALSAFVQLQRGALNGSHRSHAAWFYARGIEYVPKSD